ncbi:G-type lectin S-receptor-like serine/threonine-protein kinase At5g35370 [Ziziphus jujuba]|uniref:Receptor-like serine/threonine-protein kinase n=1 Tax=Ziziphus jujuba TaxID=326968 RepID=A0A6P3ZVW9_ZIZJJ|nr:G-type lectin S-receptor-like serine/threonine-protein kinase At5g35370 [Ziziphus jujuba]
MASSIFIFIFILFLLPTLTPSRALFSDYIKPNFTLSSFHFNDNNAGAFLHSLNSTFKAFFTNRSQLSVFHVSSSSTVWSTDNPPLSTPAKLSLTHNGLSISNDSDYVFWSTPKLESSVFALRLFDDGNLVLLDDKNGSLWQSFDNPTDTVVPGQRLAIGKALSAGRYRLTLTGSDALLQWNGLTYWKLSMDIKAYRDSNAGVASMALNNSGFYLFASDGSTVVFQVKLDGPAGFRIARMGLDGKFTISNFIASKWVVEFLRPFDQCQIPLICGRLGLCKPRPPTSVTCSCLRGFRSSNGGYSDNGECKPIETSVSLPSGCDSITNNGSISYLKLDDEIDYFANDFVQPVKRDVSVSVCKDLCSKNCSCMGIFHGSSSGSCCFLQNPLGSIMSRFGKKDRLGYIKTLAVHSPENPDRKGSKFPVYGSVLISSFGFLLIVIVVGILWLRRNRVSKGANPKLNRSKSASSGELEAISIAGLPARFNYDELEAATDNFKTQIGRGGFGIVYKGTLPDETVVAVKKITNLGVQGKREFCTEIAIIGKLHHVNLVRLKGFCAQGRQRFLVYEYMNKGSLDRSLFGNGSVLEWQERFEIALGTARGLAYLHSGCEPKIIHCDVKPENILLHGNSQVKITDFGLSKLLSPEQSALFTTMRGTRGYLAPEWLTSSPISDKADVYSYGMVLLEIVSGRKNCSLQTWSQSAENDHSSGGHGASPSSGIVYFPLLALEMHEQRRYLELADPRVEGRVSAEQVEMLVRIALCCVNEEPALRPSMVNVVGMLEGRVPLDEPRIQKLNFLRSYGRLFTEASKMEAFSKQNEFEMFTKFDTMFNSGTSGSYNSLSYISSQDVSGPR